MRRASWLPQMGTLARRRAGLDDASRTPGRRASRSAGRRGKLAMATPRRRRLQPRGVWRRVHRSPKSSSCRRMPPAASGVKLGRIMMALAVETGLDGRTKWFAIRDSASSRAARRQRASLRGEAGELGLLVENIPPWPERSADRTPRYERQARRQDREFEEFRRRADLDEGKLQAPATAMRKPSAHDTPATRSPAGATHRGEGGGRHELLARTELARRQAARGR